MHIDETIKIIQKQTKFSKQKIKQLIDKQIEELNGLIDIEGAIKIIAKKYNVNINKNNSKKFSINIVKEIKDIHKKQKINIIQNYTNFDLNKIKLLINKKINSYNKVITFNKAIYLVAKDYGITMKENNESLFINNEDSNKKEVIKIKLSEIENYTFLDIDNELDKALEHFNEFHANEFYYKLSTNKNLHVIVKNVCKKCLWYKDKYYDGNFLFLNKDNKFSSKYWQDSFGKHYTFDYKTIIHIILEDNTNTGCSLEHLYFINEIDEEKIGHLLKYNRTAGISITCHIALCKESVTDFQSYFTSSDVNLYPFDDYYKLMGFTPAKNLKFCKKYIQEFKTKYENKKD